MNGQDTTGKGVDAERWLAGWLPEDGTLCMIQTSGTIITYSVGQMNSGKLEHGNEGGGHRAGECFHVMTHSDGEPNRIRSLNVVRQATRQN